MKAKIINTTSDYSGMVMEVKRLNYKHISGRLQDSLEKVTIPYEDVEFIFDYEWEKNIIRYRDILNISLPKGVSPKFYAAIAGAIEEHHGDGIANVGVLSDTNEKARKKYWYKRIVVIINYSRPVIISASGREYSGMYNINMEDMDKNDLIFECREGICRLKKMIGLGVEQLSFYEKVLYNLENPNKNGHKAIEGR